MNNSLCEVCYQSKAVCEQCRWLEQVSHLPFLPFSDSSHEKDALYSRLVVMIVCSNCETGNKTAFETLKAKLEAGCEDPDLAFLSVLPDCPHVANSIKAAFSIWWLKCRGERINLSLVRTLRNRSNKTTKEKLKRLLLKKMAMWRTSTDKIHLLFLSYLGNSKLADELSNTDYGSLPYSNTRVGQVLSR